VKQTLLAALAGTSNLVGTALYARAGEIGLVAIVSAASALFPLVPVLGGYLLSRERLDRLQAGGIAVGHRGRRPPTLTFSCLSSPRAMVAKQIQIPVGLSPLMPTNISRLKARVRLRALEGRPGG
jgi:hypothetical protein